MDEKLEMVRIWQYIRNNKLLIWFLTAFQTAVALAEYDAEKDDEGKILLKDTHLSSIVDLSEDFKKYLDDTLGADEDKRAAMERIRHDRDRNWGGFHWNVNT
jgi:hypothetical protein